MNNNKNDNVSPVMNWGLPCCELISLPAQVLTAVVCVNRQLLFLLCYNMQLTRIHIIYLLSKVFV